MTLRELRRKKGFETGSALAEAAGVWQTTVSQLERGAVRYPTYTTVALIADALGVTPAVVARAIAATPRQQQRGAA